MTLEMKQALALVEKNLEALAASGRNGRIEVVIENGRPVYVWTHEGCKITV